MSSSLIPEKPLVVFPSLAATIGLEEAVMLSLLNDIALCRAQPDAPLDLNESQVTRLLPFWNDYDIQRISRNLRDQGIIALSSAPYQESRRLTLTFSGSGNAQAAAPARARRTSPASANLANLIAPNWQPDTELMRHIAQHGIPDYFVRRHLPEFIAYWRERGESHHAWGARFLKHLLRQWRAQETDQFRRDQEVAMYSDWRPSQDALEVLVKHANISLAFIEDAVAEFVLYWRERGDVTRTWNSKFIQHVKRQWLRYNSALEHSTEPQRLPADWQPSQDVYDVLRLANIELEFARRLVPEFTLYWRESNQVHSSWNTKFLQHVKYHWARQHALNTPQQAGQDAGQQAVNPESRTRDRSLFQDLTDRSWAR